MATLLMRLKGPMQSWGTRSRFDTRDTENEPSKSGVLGLICAAMGVDRDNWEDLEPLTKLRFGVRIDQPGVIKRDYHTAMNIIKAGQSGKENTAVTNRYYIADASFLVGLESTSEGDSLLKKIHLHLKNPCWPLYLGRKSFVPSEPVFLSDGVLPGTLEDALKNYPYTVEYFRRWSLSQEGTIMSVENDRIGKMSRYKARLIMKFETSSPEGSVYMDQPIGPFSQRNFGARYVISNSIEKDVKFIFDGFDKEETDYVLEPA